MAMPAFAVAAVFAINRSGPPRVKGPVVQFYSAKNLSDSLVNPMNILQGIDSSFIQFKRKVLPDTMGVLELSGSNQPFNFVVIDSMKLVDSLKVEWQIITSMRELSVLASLSGTYSDTFAIHQGPPASSADNESIFTPITVKVGGLAGTASQYIVPGGLAVVVITIDPSDFPSFNLAFAGYKLKGGKDWIPADIPPLSTPNIPILIR